MNYNCCFLLIDPTRPA